MKKILITGSNGMIGQLVLSLCLERADVSNVISITRKKIGIQHPKLTEIIHHDFLHYNDLYEQMQGIDICFYCIGVYTGQVPRDTFRKITVDFTKALGDALKINSSAAGICFLSGQGADSTEKSRVMFALDKGIAENYLVQLNFPHIAIFRPGYIYPVTPRIEPNLFYWLSRILYKYVLNWLYPNIGVSSVQLAKAMVHVGFHGKGQIIYENRDIRALVTD
jgi:nucleoside-diphosphate-sugar epimerase